MNRDLHNNLKFSRGISPAAAVTDNTPFVSQILDTANFNSAEFIILAGSLADADATFTVLVEDGNNSALSDAAAVNDDFLLGLEATTSLTFADDNVVKKIGYIGAKRYVRVTITPANNTGNAFIAGVWAQGGARVAPQA